MQNLRFILKASWIAGLALAAAANLYPQKGAPQTGGSGDIDTGGEDLRIWSGHVSQTRIHLRDLGIAPYDVIPAGQTAITSLLAHSGGHIYGGTTGESANLFVFSPDHNIVFPLGTIPGEESVYHSLVEGAGGLVYLGTTRDPDRRYTPDDKLAKSTGWYYRSVTEQIRRDYAAYAGGHLYSYSPRSTRINYLQENFRINKPCPLTDLGIPVPHQGIYTLLMDSKTNAIYGITYPDSHFFRYDIEAKKTEVLDRLSTNIPSEEYVPRFSKVLVQDQKGFVYASAERARIIRYDPARRKLERLPAALPGLRGREVFNSMDAAALHPGGLIYGGTTDGFVFSLAPESGTVVNLGKPLMETEIRAMSVGRDGKVYGIGGRRGGVARLFVYDPEERSFRDLGMLEHGVVPYYEWHGLLFDAMATGRDGSLYLGNSEHRSRLFIYNP